MSTQSTLSPPAPETAAPVLVYRVSPRALPFIWKQAKPHLLRGLERTHGEHTMDDIQAWILSGSHDLWVVTQAGRTLAAIVTQIIRYNSGKRAWNVVQAGGYKPALWIHEVVKQMGEFGHLHGVTHWRVVGRRGWQRYLARYGFKPEAVVLTYEEILNG